MGNAIDKVIPGLYVGGFLGTNSKEKLKEHNITHILAIHDTAEPQHPEDYVYKCIKVPDSTYTDLSVYFSDCVDFIHNCRITGGAVFVHCAAGISRSVTMTVMYIMTVSSLDFEESLTVVQFCREMANPNFGFRQQLRVYSETKLPEERKRVLAQFPNTDKLGDEQQLRDLLKQARVKFSQSSPAQQGFYSFNPDAFSRKKSD